jgi:hypothetical protein
MIRVYWNIGFLFLSLAYAELANVLYIHVPLVAGEMYNIQSNASYVGIQQSSSGERVLDFWKPIECQTTEIQVTKHAGYLELKIPCWRYFEDSDIVSI